MVLQIKVMLEEVMEVMIMKLRLEVVVLELLEMTDKVHLLVEEMVELELLQQ
jgi:hypothetical protein